ncbi:MAG: 5-methyltetrahydropteroyltriglutamate--homocysteine S-methyltransferase [Candidatus Sulfotelmatobacter sp.]
MPTATIKPPFRVEHVGSLLRPERLLDGARKLRAGALSEPEFRKLQDECIVEVVRFQEGLGLASITDGEYRRRAWSTGFIDAVSGFGFRDSTLAGFKSEKGDVMPPPSPYAKARLVREKGIATQEFAYLKSVVRTGVPKITIPSPSVMHFFLGPQAVDNSIYPDIEIFFDDLVRIYQDEIAELTKLGCTYLQFDDTALPCLCDANNRAGVSNRGEDPVALMARYVRLINDAIKDRPPGMTVGIHLCRGNFKGAWMAEGGYEPVADALFNDTNVDGYFLEYDTPRAGDFKPLRLVPKDKVVVLGLISTKTPQLERKDDIKRRIEEAARYVSLEQLCLSPQCGFSSAAGGGQVLTMDDTRRKIDLMQSIAADLWGDG